MSCVSVMAAATALPSLSGAQLSPPSLPATTKTPGTDTRGAGSSGSNRAERTHTVPIVCTGQTRDTTKLTTTPADHDTLKMCSDSKRTGIRTNPGIIHSVGVPSTPPPDKLAVKVTPEITTKTQGRGTAGASLRQEVCTELSMQCQAELLSKLKWCTSELERPQSLEHSIQVCRLITAAGEALKTLQELPLSSSTTPDHSNRT